MRYPDETDLQFPQSDVVTSARIRQSWLVRMHYRVRAVSFALAFVATSMQIYGKGYSPAAWIFLGLLFLVYPHFQYWRASTAQKPVQAERINLLIDSVLLGLFAAALQFSIWLSFAAILANLINSVANKGWRGVPQSIVALLAGALLWISVNGFKLSLHSAWPTTMVCIVGLAGYVLVMVHVGFKRNLQLRDIKTRQRVILEGVQSGVIAMSERGIVESFNQSAEQMFGYGAAEVVGNNVSVLMPEPCQGKHDGDLDNNLHSDVKKAIGRRCEMLGRRKDGSRFHMALGVYETLLNDRRLFIATASDISAHKQAQDRIELLAFSDPLTGLPNRRLLMDRLHQALAASARLGLCGAVLLIDLDDFKTLNDTLGHDKGDLLLQQVAQRLTTCVRAGDTVARLGGDEFVVMLEELSPHPDELARDALGVGEKILAMLALPYALKGYQYRSTPSIGIAPFDGAQTSVGELLKQADLAMYQAKTAGRNTLRLFNPDMQAVVTARAALEEDFRSALAQDEFLLHYQPQVNQAGQCVGVEALVRWAHPQRGLVSPAEFIPLAEETGLILALGRWVLHNACTLLASWQDVPQLSHLTMAVNVSSSQFRHASFVDDVARVLAITGAPSGKLKLELTESLLVEDMETTIATMTALRSYGVGFSLDDFGTGYSSLGYLKRMPLDQLKIDQSFVRDLLTDPNDAAIVDTIIALSRSLGLEVIAEGVETPEQRDLLIRAGCHRYQGYLFSRPLPMDLLEAFLRPEVT